MRTGRPVPPEASDSESFSEFGEGTFSSVGGSRADADEFDNPRSLYTHDEEEEETVLEDEAIDGKNNRSVLDDLPPPPSPADKSLETCNLGTSQAKFAGDIALSSLAPADSHTLRMIAMDPVRLRFCSPPLHLPGSSNDLVCPSEYLIDAFAIHEVLIRYGYLLRLSPFKIEDFLAALISNENSLLLAEVHITLLRALLREDEATGTWMYSIDC
ncbi:Nucleosome-remodeling factor subunit BPTF, partial [Fasciola gigantica]